MKECPNCFGTKLTTYPIPQNCIQVICDGCGMRGPVEGAGAIKLWDALPRKPITLSPCISCGSKKDLQIVETLNLAKFAVFCPNCGLHGPWDSEQSKCADYWNTLREKVLRL